MRKRHRTVSTRSGASEEDKPGKISIKVGPAAHTTCTNLVLDHEQGIPYVNDFSAVCEATLDVVSLCRLFLSTRDIVLTKVDTWDIHTDEAGDSPIR